MTDVWQNVIVLGIVAAAIAYVARLAWRRGRSKGRSGCPACNECTGWWEEASLGSDDTSPACCDQPMPKVRDGAPD